MRIERIGRTALQSVFDFRNSKFHQSGDSNGNTCSNSGHVFT
jgi:hypothetical protein